MKPTIFAPSARAEFEAAAEWYETHADGLGERFVSCVGEIIGRIEAAAPVYRALCDAGLFRAPSLIKAVLAQFDEEP
jgi:hypothetical protein